MKEYTVLVHEAEEGGFWAEVEELPGCFASGDTLDELEADVRAAIETYIEACKEIGWPIPEGKDAGGSSDRRWGIAIPA